MPLAKTKSETAPGHMADDGTYLDEPFVTDELEEFSFFVDEQLSQPGLALKHRLENNQLERAPVPALTVRTPPSLADPSDEGPVVPRAT